MINIEIIESFRNAILAAGITPPSHIEADGRMHRFSTNGKPSDKDGAYVLHPDGIPAGYFKDWITGIEQNWCSRDYKTFTQAEKKEYALRMAQIRGEREQEEKENREEARQRANEIWEKSKEVTTHPYLTRKQVKAYGIKESKGSIVVPVCDNGEIQSLQFINPDGDKKFLAGGRKKGCYFSIGAETDVICIAEGYATGASVHESTGFMTIVGFDSGNLLSVGNAIREKYPEAKIVFCADDDAFTHGNPGLTQAKEAAMAVGGYVAVPNFGDKRMKNQTDFNDLSRTTGLENVKTQIDSAIKIKKAQKKTKHKEQSEKIDAKMILALVKAESSLFHDKTQNGYACVKIGGKPLNILIESQMFEDWLSRICWRNFKTALKSNLLKDCVSTLRAEACFDSPCHSVFSRIGFDGSNIYLDLADNEGQLVKINEQGWEIINDSPIKFVRTNSMQPLVKPEGGGDINNLFQFINIPIKSQKLVLAWLLECFRLNTPFPILALYGLQGSAKSTTQEFLRDLIDPSQPNLRGAPKKREDLMVAAVNNYIMSLNNVSHLSAEQQDDLCCVSTGGGYSTRKLYTTNHEQTNDIKRPVILNGINEVITAQDLIDRSISVELPIVIEETRKTESVIKQQFEAAKPKLLGAMLDVLVATLRELSSVLLDKKPRMADFAMLGTALEKVMSWEAGSFMADYLHQQSETRIAALEHSPIIMALIDYVEDEPYTGSFKKLHNILTTKQRTLDYGALFAWPKSPKGLSEALKRQQPALGGLGIKVAFDPIRRMDGYHVSIEKITSDRSVITDILKNKKSFEKQVHYVHEVHNPTDLVASKAPLPMNIDSACSASSLSSSQVHANSPTGTRAHELNEHNELINENFFKKNDLEDGWVTEIL